MASGPLSPPGSGERLKRPGLIGLNIEEVIKFYNLGDKTFATDFNIKKVWRGLEGQRGVMQIQKSKHFVRKVKEVKFHKMYDFEKVKILAWKVKNVGTLHKEVRKIKLSQKV